MAKNPLEPIATISKVAFWFVIIVSLGFTVAAIVNGDQVSVLGIGADSVCQDDPSISVDPQLLQSLAKPDAQMMAAVMRFCDHTVSAEQALLTVAKSVTDAIFAYGSIYLLWRLIRVATREGAYATAVVRRLRVLGWWLFAGGALSSMIVSVVEYRLRMTLQYNVSYAWPQFPVSILLTGLGVITFARIMRIGVAMREDLEGTV
ncbi:hypothetical protein GCM10010149_59080 [Nonomuraea roseoviolacea subsp. roseoviolacea]|uniref:DUF2975 domain-containing protein n=1 Tax=Nonomuraea roseoviolacea TaxID=103837 RepID=UPI0031DB309F